MRCLWNSFPLILPIAWLCTPMLPAPETQRVVEGGKALITYSRISFMEPAFVRAAVVLLYHQGELMCQCLPLGRCTQAYWRQTPWHTGGHLPEETSWGLSHNSDTWEGTESQGECQRDAGEPREGERMTSYTLSIWTSTGLIFLVIKTLQRTLYSREYVHPFWPKEHIRISLSKNTINTILNKHFYICGQQVVWIHGD